MHYINKTIQLIVLSLFILSSAAADDGSEAYELGRDYRRQSGDTEENNRRAAEAFQEAIESGHVRAHNDLAFMYLKGEGVEKDPARARQLFRIAAEEELDIAQYQLAELLRKGEGGDRDVNAALQWYQRAATGGHVGAMTRLGALYSSASDDIEPDPPRALAWYILAKQNGGYVSNGKLEMLERGMRQNERNEVEQLLRELAPSTNNNQG